jgi:putative ABC transport system permease protein
MDNDTGGAFAPAMIEFSDVTKRHPASALPRVFKTVGMTSRQATAITVCWVAGTCLAAGLVAVLGGVAVHRYLMPPMTHSAGLGLRASHLNSCDGWELAALVLAGVLIAVAEALPPAGGAAKIRDAEALRTR